MLKQENLAANFCGLLASKGFKGKFKMSYSLTIPMHLESTLCLQGANIELTSHLILSLEPANEFKILGQEKDGTILTTWISKSSDEEVSIIGCYNPKEKSFDILKRFFSRENIAQASVNLSKNLLLYILKNQIQTDNCESDDENEKKFLYSAFLVEITQQSLLPILEFERSKQVMVNIKSWRYHRFK